MNILFLQGLATPFMKRLACLLAAQGHKIHKVHFCGGDVLFWRGGQCAAPHLMREHYYRGPLDDLPEFYQRFLADKAIGAVVLFGDTRPVHESAIAAARQSGIPVYVLEEGYVRPDWITLDMNGANAASSLPRDAGYYLAHYSDPDKRARIERAVALGGGFKRRVAMDIALHIANLAAWPVFPRYRTHRPHIAGLEYAGFIARGIKNLWRGRLFRQRYQRLIGARGQFYFLPLQLDGDSQIRRHCEFSGMGEVMETVFSSFAANAPAGTLLAIKLHPLDNGLTDYSRICRDLADKAGIADRVVYFEGGALPKILRAARGVITVNSTVGLSAIIHTKPVKVLGRALYGMDGLTFRGPLDDFWHTGFLPDMDLLRIFRAGLIAETQINGNFFTRKGIEIGARNAMDRILS